MAQSSIFWYIISKSVCVCVGMKRFMQGYKAPFALVLMYICSRSFVFESLCLARGCIYITNASAPNVFYLHCEFLHRSYDCLPM